MSIIGLTGNLGCGKDTVAKMIQYYFRLNKNPHNFGIVNFLNNDFNCYNNLLEDSDWQIKKFAYKLKQIAAILVGCEASDFESE